MGANSIELASQEKFSEINISGFSSNFSSRLKGLGQAAVSPFSDDLQRQQQNSEKREIQKLKLKIEERDECIKTLVLKINEIEKSVNNLHKSSANRKLIVVNRHAQSLSPNQGETTTSGNGESS